MPFKSQAQRKYMNWAASTGKIKKSVVDEFNNSSQGLELPDVAPKPETPETFKFKKIRSKLKGLK